MDAGNTTPNSKLSRLLLLPCMQNGGKNVTSQICCNMLLHAGEKKKYSTAVFFFLYASLLLLSRFLCFSLPALFFVFSYIVYSTHTQKKQWAKCGIILRQVRGWVFLFVLLLLFIARHILCVLPATFICDSQLTKENKSSPCIL